MKRRIVSSLIGVFVFLIIFTAASSSFAAITWTWQRFDFPVSGEYQASYGNSQSTPVAVLPKYIVPDAASYLDMMAIHPAFTPKKLVGPVDTIGTIRFRPRHDEIQAFINDVATSPEGMQRLRIKPLGEYPKGMPLVLAVFSKPAVLEPDELKALGKPIVWLEAAVHANEQDAVDGLLYAFYKLGTGAWDSYLEHTSVIMFLRVNADGSKYNIRGNPTRPDKTNFNTQGTPSAAIDLNRDHAWLEAPILRVLHSTWSSYYPHITVDMHQMASGSNNFGGTGWVASKDASGNEVKVPGTNRVQLLISRDATGAPIRNGNALINMAPAVSAARTLYYIYDITSSTGDHGNVPPSLRSYYFDKIFPSWEAHMKSKGLGLWNYLEERTPGMVMRSDGEKYYLPYYGADNRQDGTGYPAGGSEGLWLDYGNTHALTALKGSVGILCESRCMSGHGPWTYERRVYAQSIAMESIIKFAAENAAGLKKVVEDARDEIVKAEKVYTMMKYDSEPYVAYNVEYYDASGDIVCMDVPMYSNKTVSARDANPPRKNPRAYILPKTETNAVTAARMGFHGVKYYQLKEDVQVNVEVFENLELTYNVHPITNQRRNADRYGNGTAYTPGFFVKADEPVAKTVSIPKGSFVIYTDQPLGAYVAAVMEPDAERSFARLTMAHPVTGKTGNGASPVPTNPDPNTWSVPYRYMGTASLPTAEVIQYYPLVEKATIVDVRPITGSDLDALSDYVMAQDMDVISDQDGFIMQLPSSASGLTFYAFDWIERKYVELEKASVNYNVAFAYKIKPSFINPISMERYSNPNAPEAFVLRTNQVRIAATDKSVVDPEKPWWEDIGCNAGIPFMVIFVLAGVMLRKKF